MIKPLHIGSLHLPHNLIQAPLAGYSCAPMRVLAHQWGAPAYCCTEMISAKHLISNPQQMHRYLYKDPNEGLLCYQLSSNNPTELAKAVKIVDTHGADLIDLNCGCPKPKIRKKGTGTKLLSTPTLLGELVQAMRESTNKPVTVKIRVDGNSDDHFNADVLDTVQNNGANALIVHGRHWTDNYDTPVLAKEIKWFVDHANIPVIANGDITDQRSLAKMYHATGCAGFMVARASTGNPWLFKQLRDITTTPKRSSRVHAYLEHCERLANLIGEYPAVLQARKLLKYYQLIDNAAMIYQAKTLADIQKILRKRTSAPT